MKNLNNAASYCIRKSKSNKINFLLAFIILFIIAAALLCSEFFTGENDPEVLLIMYVSVLGTMLILSNTMMIELTGKDKLCHRFEFFLGSGIKFEDIIKAYIFQIFRFSGIVPFVLFMIFYLKADFSYSFIQIVLLYLSIAVLAYGEILFLNIYIFTIKNNKLIKNMILFSTFFIIYLIGIFSEEIIKQIMSSGVPMPNVLIIFNIVCAVLLIAAGKNKMRKSDNEYIIGAEG